VGSDPVRDRAVRLAIRDFPRALEATWRYPTSVTFIEQVGVPRVARWMMSLAPSLMTTEKSAILLAVLIATYLATNLAAPVILQVVRAALRATRLFLSFAITTLSRRLSAGMPSASPFLDLLATRAPPVF
jgi:hypothetical protein